MIKQKRLINNIYKNLITPVLKYDSGIDAEYLTNISLNLLSFASKKRDWPLIANLIENLNYLSLQ